MFDIKYVESPTKFLLDSGLLFNINRIILHPFGLAMEVDPDNEGVFKLWDYREDPEGMLFADGAMESGRKKLMEFMGTFGDKKIEERIQALGYIIQEWNDNIGGNEDGEV